MSYTARQREGQGWLVFAAVVLITAGVMRIFDAFWAFDRNDEVSDNLQVLVFDENLNAYGWIWLLLGLLLVAAGVGVLSGAQWARWFGIGVSALAAVTASLWIYAFPIWSLVGVVLAMSVIYALATYGSHGIGDTG